MRSNDLAAGLDALRHAVLAALRVDPAPQPTGASGPAHPSGPDAALTGWLLSETAEPQAPREGGAFSSAEDESEQLRLIALVDLARAGDREAFGLLYDHYVSSVHRFLLHRTRSMQLAEDLTSETFFRALRSMQNFTWQGKDFGAWLMTIARNLATDHFKSAKARLELTTEDMSLHDTQSDGPERAVLDGITHEVLLQALATLPTDQRDCLVMRFLQSMSISETALALGKSEGAVKQLQLRAVRALAKQMPEGIR